MRSFRFAAIALAAAQVAVAQSPAVAPAALTLDEALTLARRNNPDFLRTASSIRTADLGVRDARGAFLPTSGASLNGRYQQGGQQFFQGVALSSSSNSVQSSYSLGLGWGISGAELLAPRLANAQRDAAEADVNGAAESLRATVTQLYINVLQGDARAAVTDSLIVTAKAQLELARARMEVGAGNALEVTRGEYGVGQAEVAAVNAHNNAEVERLRLYEVLGVGIPDTPVRLTTTFSITRPTFTRDSLLELARQINPALVALRTREKASEVSMNISKSSYLPSFNISTGWGGNGTQYTDPEFLVNQARAGTASSQRSCLVQDSIRTRVGLASLNCSSIVFTDAQADAIRASNEGTLFKFRRSPLGISAGLSFNVFDGFARESRVQRAQIDRDNARHAIRSRELAINTAVTAAYYTVMTALRTVELQEQNAAKARQELAYAEERFRVGAAPFLDVTTSRVTFSQAQIDRVNSIYDFHKAFAALESAVGRPLR